MSKSSSLKFLYLGAVVNIILAIVKSLAGFYGNSFALLADGVESLADLATSLIVIYGFLLSHKPPDEEHPYGHGKFEPMIAVIIGCFMVGASLILIFKSIDGIFTPNVSPASFTLIVLLLTVIIKEWMFRSVLKAGQATNSNIMVMDAWHHRSDAITSLAAFLGIAVSLIGGNNFAIADEIAAIFASSMIAFNGLSIIKPALYELLDTAPDRKLSSEIRKIAVTVEGVYGTHKCYVRKIGFNYYVDLDVLCDPFATITEGHNIAHKVGEAIQSAMPIMTKVLVHVEPFDDYGKRSVNKIGEESEKI